MTCPYCGTELDGTAFDFDGKPIGNTMDEGDGYIYTNFLVHCPECNGKLMWREVYKYEGDSITKFEEESIWEWEMECE